MKHLPLLILIIFFNFSCTQLLPLKAIRVSRTTVESTVTTTSAGTVEAVQQAVLGFSAQGRIEHINTAIGDHVKKSQILAELENSDFKIIFQNSDRELKRAEELFQAGLVSQAALDDSKRNYEVAKANLDKTMIKAPFDGVISELKLEIGELYQATQTPQSKAPIRLIDMKPRIIKGDVDELDLSKIKTGLKAKVKILAIRSMPYNAEVSKVIPFVSTLKEKDRTSEIELKILETSDIIPVGASADIEVIIEQKLGVLAIPTRTILGRGDSRYVYCYKNGQINKTPIKTGIGNYDRTEILFGVNENDTVIFPPEDIELKDKMSAKIELKQWP